MVAVPVFVGVLVIVGVFVMVAVRVGVPVLVGVLVMVGVLVIVGVKVLVGVLVIVGVRVMVGVFVIVAVLVGVGVGKESSETPQPFVKDTVRPKEYAGTFDQVESALVKSNWNVSFSPADSKTVEFPAPANAQVVGESGSATLTIVLLSKRHRLKL